MKEKYSFTDYIGWFCFLMLPLLFLAVIGCIVWFLWQPGELTFKVMASSMVIFIALFIVEKWCGARVS